jgi:hypothetical protein
VTEAIILNVGGGGPGGGGRGGGNLGFEAMTDRMSNAINGLPEDARADAQAQLDQEVTFYKNLQKEPAEARPQLLRDHMMAKIANGNDNAGRRSPEKRAQRYARVVANRETAQGKTPGAK